jgi:hypothetical protein
MMDTKPKPDDTAVAHEIWDRYKFVVGRGHREYTRQAQLCERMYLGGGRQWDADEAAALLAQKRQPYEFNEILPSVNSAIGHQIRNRLNIALRPRGGKADQAQAEIRSKVLMQIADSTHYHWKETEVFADGLIQQRGFFDVRMSFGENMDGNLRIEVLDPLDVIPDPDSKTYEPAGWADVCRTRWLTYDEIAQDYGQDKADAVEAKKVDDADFGDHDDTGAERPKFADTARSWQDAYYTDNKVKRARVVERQAWHNVMSRVLFYPRTGEQKLAENLTAEVIAQQLAQGAVMTKAVKKRVKWQAATCDILLHDEWSPYDSFTIIPYFAFFRRGQTIGMVDNAIGPQQARNKGLAQFVHIVNSAANSGWITEENSLTNMTARELEEKGAMTGLHLEVRKGAQYPQKIQPNQVPQGVDRLVQITTDALKSVTVPDAMRGQDGPQTSGLARQTQQFAAQQQIAIPLDNLARTRHLMAEKKLQLVQQFYSEPRIFRITEMDFATGKPVETPIPVNQYDPQTGAFINDLTEGDYDVVISEQPIASTFEDSQFQQAMDMRKAGVGLPDTVVVQSSSLARKAEIVEQMQNAQAPADPLAEAKAALLAAQARKTDAQAVLDGVTGMFSATQAANQIAAVPAIAPLADALLKSAGFVDKDAAPIVPQPAGGIGAMPVPQPEPNTSPNMPAIPASPAAGAASGIERMDPAIGEPQ